MLTIYTLCDPASGEVRYVGMSRRPAYRLKQYMARGGGHTPHLRNWLESVNRQPVQVCLETVDAAEADVRERYWIALLRSYDARLINYTDGGEGGFTHAPATKVRLREGQQRLLTAGRHNFMHPEARARVRAVAATRRGRPIPWLVGHASWNTGKACPPLTEEHKRKCSEALRGRKLSKAHRLGIAKRVKAQWADPAWKAKMRAALRGKDHSSAVAASAEHRRGVPLTEEHRRKVSEGQKASWTPERRLAASQARKGKAVTTMTPEIRAKLSASVRAYFAARREAKTG